MTTETGPRALAFLDDERGAINLEFMLWLPMMLLWTVGFVSLFEGYSLRNEAAKAHYTVADMVSRSEELSNTELARYADLHAMLTPSVPGGEGLRVTQIAYLEVDGEMVYAVDWSCGFPVADLPPLDHGDIPTGLLPTTMALNQRVVLVQTVAPYAPAFNVGTLRDRDLEFDTVVRPRRVPAIALTAAGGDCIVPEPPTSFDDSLMVVGGGSTS